MFSTFNYDVYKMQKDHTNFPHMIFMGKHDFHLGKKYKAIHDLIVENHHKPSTSMARKTHKMQPPRGDNVVVVVDKKGNVSGGDDPLDGVS